MIGLGVLGSGGCFTYATVPGRPLGAGVGEVGDPNVEAVMVASLRWAIATCPGLEAGGNGPVRHASGTPPLAINLPPGASAYVYSRVARRVGPGVVPASPQTADRPTFHVTFVRVRGDEARVHLVRPVYELGGVPQPQPLWQDVIIDLRGGARPWRVVAWRDGQPGLARVPPLYLPDADSAPAGQAVPTAGVGDGSVDPH